MEGDQSDWGLLSIADVLDVDFLRKNEILTSAVITLKDSEVPLLACGPSYAAQYAQMLIKNSKLNAEYRNSNLEEVDTFRSIKLKRSLAASELIRERLLCAIESFALIVQQESNKPSFLHTLAHLGSLVCPDVGAFCDALIDSTESMVVGAMSSPKDIGSCVEVLQLFRSRINTSILTRDQQRRLFLTEFSLALRSERLSAVVNCLLQKMDKETLQGKYSPPPLPHLVSYVKTKTDGFLTRTCELSFPIHSSQIYCFPNNEKFIVCSGNRGCVYDQLGMMGTRFKLKEQFEMAIGKNTSIILCNEKELYLAIRIKSSMGNISYSLQKCDRVSGKILVKTNILFCVDDSITASRDVLFDISDSTLSCLISSESSLRISNSKCHLLQKDLDTVFSKDQHEFHVTSQNALKRCQGLWHTTKKSYYFTKNNPISIGRITLKENFHPFTIEMWVYPCNALDNQTVLSLGDKSSDEILIEIEPTSEGIIWRGGSRTPHLGASFVTYTVPGKLTFCQRWWHIALLFKGNSWELWINDAIVSHSVALVSPEALIDVECVLGKSFVGCLAEVRIWSCCRTPVQLSRDCRSSIKTSEPLLCGYFPLDESEGDVISDYALNGSHALLHHGQATWLSVNQFPITLLNNDRCIYDFAPIAWRESSGNLFFSSCPGYISLAIPTEGPSFTICEYTTCDLKLVFQARIEVPPRTVLKGVSYNALRHSLVCYGSSLEHSKRLLIWELHQQHYFPFLQKDMYENISEYERDLLIQCATYAKYLVGAERCLVDQLSWSVQVSGLVVDTSKGLISSLLRFIHHVLFEQKDYDYTKQLYSLLHANLLCRVENQREGLVEEIGDVFPDANTLIKVAQEEYSKTINTQSELLRLSFQEKFFDTGLLSMTCRCLLSEKSRLQFIKNQAGKGRLTEKEDMLFRSLLEYYSSLQASSLLLENTEHAQLFCSSLMAEEIFQIDRWLGGMGQEKTLEAIKRTSHSLEVFQEILLAKAMEKSKGESYQFLMTYAKMLLKISEKIMEMSSKPFRKNPDFFVGKLTKCIEVSAVGALLPSFTIALPLLPTNIQSNCLPFLKGCREALFTFTDTVPREERLPYELGIALTSTLCRIGCSLLISSDVATSKVDLKYLYLLCGGIRKSGSERDAAIKNIQQGVGTISKVIDELHKEDPGAVLILRDSKLVKIERLLMSTFCALLLPTESLKKPTKENLSPIFRYIHNMRSLLLSKRQENPKFLDLLEEKAKFLSRFELIINPNQQHSTSHSSSSTGGNNNNNNNNNVEESSSASNIRTTTTRMKSNKKDMTSQRKWKRYFQTWKALRVLKTKLPQQRDVELNEPGGIILQFLWDKNIERETVDHLVIQQTQKSHYRLSGMLLLKQLIEESKASCTIANIVLPILSKVFTGWHYSDDVQCCSKGDFLRLHGCFFQLLELIVNHVNKKKEKYGIWGDMFLSLLMSELRIIDFKRMREDVVTTLYSLWKYENQKYIGVPFMNRNIPEHIRNIKLSPNNTAPNLVIGHSGCTIKSLGGRGTCVVPLEWSSSKARNTPYYYYYYEVLIIDMYSGGSCCVGVGPADYSVSRLPGWESESYALQTEEGTLHESNSLGRPVGCTFTVGDVVGCGWNTETKKIYWTKNGKDIVASIHVQQQQLYPLIGICGKGLIKVNFGAERFMFDKLLGLKPVKPYLAENAWCVFRVFSIRAALSLVDSCVAQKTHNNNSGSTRGGGGGDSSEGLRAIVEQCIECNYIEIERIIFSSCNNHNNSELFVISLSSHLITLGKILKNGNDEGLIPCIQRAISSLQRGTHHLLNNNRKNNKNNNKFSSKLRCLLLKTWFTFINLIPPDFKKEDENILVFLETLLSLGREIEYTLYQSHSKVYGMGINMELWTCLSLLQFINSESDPPHQLREKLHEWIMKALDCSSKDKINISLALHILFGSSRLLLPGDFIMIQKPKHTKLKGIVIDYSLDDEICEIIENEEKHQTVSLREADMILGDENYNFIFPQKENKFHEKQIHQILLLAKKLWSEEVVENTTSNSTNTSSGLLGNSIRCKILTILWRCMQKGFLLIPNELLFMLIKNLDHHENFMEEYLTLIQEKLIIEHCLVGKIIVNNNSSSSNPTNGSSTNYNNESRELRTRLAQGLSMRGYNLDLCFLALDETNNDIQMALQLLGDHHGDFMSTRRRPTSSFSEDDELSSDDGDIDAAEYDLHVLFPPESEDGMDDELSVDHMNPPLSDGIRFLGGYIYVTSEYPLSYQFTVDMSLYILDIVERQIIFHQKSTTGEWELVCYIQSSALYCGWIHHCRPGKDNNNKEVEGEKKEETFLCEFPIDYSDTLHWVQLTYIQDDARMFLYKNNIVQSEKKFSKKCLLFECGISFGGSVEDDKTRFNGGMKNIKIFPSALKKEDLLLLLSLKSLHNFPYHSLLLECVQHNTIEMTPRGFLYNTQVSIVNSVTWFERNSNSENNNNNNNEHNNAHNNNICLQEIDFTLQNNKNNIFHINDKNDMNNFIILWRKRKDQKKEYLFTSLLKLNKQLICYYTIAILIYMLRFINNNDNNNTYENMKRFLRKEYISFIIKLVVNSLDFHLIQFLKETVKYLIQNENHFIVNFILEELINITQQEQKMLMFESSHPFKSTSETAHEVYVPNRKCYEIYFDARCFSSNMLVTFYVDHTLSSIITQTPGYALNPLLIHTSRFFFDVRMDSSTPQWGYKIIILYDTIVPRCAAKLLRFILSLIISQTKPNLEFLKTSACLESLANASRINVGITRRIILSCLTDIFLHAAEYIEPMSYIDRMHDIRRMAERLLRRSLESQHLQSRFTQIVTEFYVMLKDVEHCWSIKRDDKMKIQNKIYDATIDTECFLQKRSEQRDLYKKRDGIRVTVEKIVHPESLRIGINPNKTILVWSERSGSSIVTDAPLGSGKWYFELRMMATGDVYIGVLPSVMNYWTITPSLDNFIAFNGKTGVFCGIKNSSVTPRRIWKAKDYIGVVMDGNKKTCCFFVNGHDTGIVFSFDFYNHHNNRHSNENEAISVASLQPFQDEKEVSYYPFFVLEEEEGVTINFGGTHFEYEPPRDCFPLDPINLSLGTLIPYNQIRAFHDLAAYITSTKGSVRLPTFFHEEANPFDGSTERFGPPHVSLHSDAGVQINLLLVRNTGTRFSTVRANCRVSGGRWYYEVTLRSQGLIQIGWSSSNDVQSGSVGDTPASWSIDMFRRLKWHNGKCEPLTASRRWVVGDIIGCALDLIEKKMVFLYNGRLLCDSTLNDCTFTDLPDSLSYEPAVSLRAGNEILFNFGSSSFKYKPEGFSALGVPDSWNERMDTFYSTLQPSTTLLRLKTLREIWLSLDQLKIKERIKHYQFVVDTIQEYCRREGKGFAQITEEMCLEIFKNTSISSKEAWEAYKVLVAFSRVSQAVIPFLHLDIHYPNVSTKLFLVCRSIFFASLRNEMIDDILRMTNVRAEHLRVSINRIKARANKNAWFSSVFGQTFSLLADQHPRIFRTNRRFWGVVFLGEGSEDVGGPFREHIGEMCRELMSTSLPLFVPTANNVHNTGTYRDAFVPAASATGTAELAAFMFLGQLMGGAMRNNEPLGLFFPPIVWKFLSFHPIEESDIDDVDRICLQCILEFRSLKNRVLSNDLFDEVFDAETFTTRLSDGSVKELIPGGGNVRVTLERCEEYANALSQARLSEYTQQLGKMREGLLNVIPETVICMLTPSELEFRVCGKPDYSVGELREGVVYEGLTSDDRRVQFLWQALEDATPLQRRLFLRFVSGRDRLPVKLRVLPLSTPGDADSVLPRAATCFFALEIPDYSSVEVLKSKLYYSIENCADIDTDFNPREVDESEAPQLMVGLEDTRQEEVDSATLSD